MMILTLEEFIGDDEPFVRIGIASHSSSYVILKPNPGILIREKGSVIVKSDREEGIEGLIVGVGLLIAL